MTDLRDTVRTTEADALLRDYHDARRKEEQWRIPQLLTALLTPILVLVSVLFNMAGNDANSEIAGGLALIVAAAAALIAIEVWRWHRIASSRVNTFRTEFPTDIGLLAKDPI